MITRATMEHRLHDLDILPYGELPVDLARVALLRRSRLQRKLAHDPLGVFIRRLETKQLDVEARVQTMITGASALWVMALQRVAKQGAQDAAAQSLRAQAQAADAEVERLDAYAVRIGQRIAALKRRREFGLAIVGLLGRKD